MQARYDRVARGYARWWAPVLAPIAVRVLDLVDEAVRGGGRLLDVGTGTATLPLAAVHRWPAVRVTGIDASGEMVAAASAEADRLLDPGQRSRFEATTAFADELPFEDAAFDAAVSSFVLQLVPSRAAALREIRRVLRPGAVFAHATWLVGGRSFEPDAALDAALDLAGFDPREVDPRSGDFASVDAALAGLRRAGFREVRAEAVELAHQFDPASYQGFVQEFDEEATFNDMDRRTRRRVESDLRARLEALPREAFVMRLPVVLARGTRP
jgi:ubiquinone/menaquinone biosynthesis C-methylase UbiE